MKQGKLITFCGLDGCGKTTMIKMLEEYLLKKEYNIFLTKQPTDGVRKSDIFRTFMDNPDNSKYDYRALSLMAASDRIQHSNKVIKPSLDNGDIVISDRYFYSCIGNLHSRGYTSDKWIDEIFTYVPKPDLAFFLDVDIEKGISRIKSRPSEKDKWLDLDLYKNLKEEYKSLCRQYNGILIDSNGDSKDTFEKIKNELDKIL